MITVHSYGVALVLCIITMVCWGSWANTQKLASKEWPFQLFYWDYSIGVVIFSLVLALTLGSTGSEGRSFVADLDQAEGDYLLSAFLGGIIFNLSNLLLVAAISVAGLALAFPVGVGLALVLGVITTYLTTQAGNAPMLAVGVTCIVVAIALDAIAYKRLASSSKQPPARGIALSVSAGVLMGGFYSFVARSMGTVDPLTHVLTAGKLSPYSALVVFSIGIFLSNLLRNSIIMRKPLEGPPVSYRDYWMKGSARLHFVGLLGGVIWNMGMAFSILASGAAGAALSYGLGQGATLVGAIWGVFIWKEFAGAPRGTAYILAAMFLFYVAGLGILIASKV